MRKMLLQFIVFMCLAIPGTAQVSNGFMPYHQLFLEHPETLQKTRNQAQDRSPVYREIAMRHDTYDDTVKVLNGGIAIEYRYRDSSINFYNGLGILDSSRSLTMVNFAWRNSLRSFHFYNSSGLDSMSIEQQWDTVQNNWTNLLQFTSAYDQDNNLTSLTLLSFNTQTSQWVNVVMVTSAYDASNEDTLDSYQTWNSAGADWLNASETLTSYGADNKPALQLLELWNNSNAYAKDSEYLYSYNVLNNITSEVTLAWTPDSNNYIKNSEIRYNYNANNNDTLDDYLIWDNEGQQWSRWNGEPEYKYSYDGNNNITYEEIRVFNTSVDTFGQSERFFYYYKTFDAIDNVTAQTNLNLKVYPNPTGDNGSLISFALGEPAEISVQLFDITGRMMTNKNITGMAGANGLFIATDRLAKGLYTVKLVNNSTGESGFTKMIKQ